ncbi:MAG TPA: 4'-phosphopantetheinyl transferase superfamily protein [Polyangia bacterium]|nr:4'-phosphopantetheinyl transferase superfamily protein [Polyangia bacterium]
MEPLTGDHVFLADPAVGETPGRLARFESVMTDDERARQARLVFARDRVAFAVTRALVRAALSRYAEVQPSDWRFAPGPNGRPRVVAPAGVAAPHFSVSHTAGLIACLITPEPRAAVDVERLRPVDDALAIADRHFAPEEIAALRACAGEVEERNLFFALWTLKESFLKALGQGLSLPLDAAAFAPPTGGGGTGGLGFRLDPAHADPGARWDFQLWQPSPEHRLALARAIPAGASPPLAFSRLIPFEAPEPATVERIA